MTDTRRLLAELQAIFADDAEDPLIPQHIRDFLLSVYPNDYNVLNYGAVGHIGHDSTAAIQAAIDTAFADGKGGGVYFPPGGRYRISETIDWKIGVHLFSRGGGTGPGVHALYPDIIWMGAEGGTMFRANDTGYGWWPQTPIQNLGFNGNMKAETLIEFTEKVDHGTHFQRITLANCLGNAVRFNKGCVNFHAYDFRGDNIAEYLFYVDASVDGGGAYQLTLDKFTMDNGRLNTGFPDTGLPGGKGLLYIDGENTGPDTVNFIGISNANIEINKSPDDGHNAIVLLGSDPDFPNQVQYFLTLTNIRVTTPYGLAGQSLIRTNPATTENLSVVGLGVNISGAENELISNVTPPGPPAGKFHPFFVYAPFVDEGSKPWLRAVTSDIWLGSKVHFAEEFEFGGDLAHSGSKLGLYGTDPVPQSAKIELAGGGWLRDGKARAAISAIVRALEDVGITASEEIEP